ncbi:MAG: NAD kinase [Flavobacteriales bacterium]
MKIGIFGKQFGDDFIAPIQTLVQNLISNEFELIVFEKFHPWLTQRIESVRDLPTFSSNNGLLGCDALISIGGDGTLLDSVTIVRDSNIPILGINTGRLGFLSNVSTSEIQLAIAALKKGEYTLDKRSLIEVEVDGVDLGDLNYALNEVTVHKKETASMITIHSYMNDKFINTYWADGLIVSTPTGSTAYSLSCGGPIVMPGAESWVFTPIAPHNLNVRPLVVPHNHEIKLRAEGRDPKFLLTLDSRSVAIDSSTEVRLRNAPFQISLINLEHQDFFNTIRTKMMWGIDRRN